jgi:hypothetical protein
MNVREKEKMSIGYENDFKSHSIIHNRKGYLMSK